MSKWLNVFATQDDNTDRNLFELQLVVGWNEPARLEEICFDAFGRGTDAG